MDAPQSLDVVVTLDGAALTRAVLSRCPEFVGQKGATASSVSADLAAGAGTTDVPRWLRGGIWAFDLACIDQFAGLDATVAAFEAQLRAGKPPDPSVLDVDIDARGIAVLPVHGFITRRATFWSSLFGGTSLQELEAATRDAVANPAVKAIVLDIDSPGGSVTGVHETFEVLRAANAVKPIHASISGLGASAAYWLASAASSIAVSPSAEVGSIGVFGMHADRSAFFASRGVTFSVFASPAAKAEGTDVVPLTDEARSAMRARVESHYARFVEDVATGRSTTADAVRAGYGQGRVVGSEAALAAGLVDRIATPEAVLASTANALADRARRDELARYRAAL